jgi:hypothetical protein
MYPQNTAQRFIEVALKEVGYIEQGENLTKYGKFTGADGLPWCGSFVNWCANEAGVKIPSVVSTLAGSKVYKSKARWHETPQRGDLAFFDFPDDKVFRISHIGIVIKADKDGDGWITTIEGNTSGAGGSQRNGGEVMIKQRQYTAGGSIVGFGRPNFAPSELDFPLIPPKVAKVKEKK